MWQVKRLSKGKTSLLLLETIVLQQMVSRVQILFFDFGFRGDNTIVRSCVAMQECTTNILTLSLEVALNSAGEFAWHFVSR